MFNNCKLYPSLYPVDTWFQKGFPFTHNIHCIPQKGLSFTLNIHCIPQKGLTFVFNIPVYSRWDFLLSLIYLYTSERISLHFFETQHTPEGTSFYPKYTCILQKRFPFTLLIHTILLKIFTFYI